MLASAKKISLFHWFFFLYLDALIGLVRIHAYTNLLGLPFSHTHATRKAEKTTRPCHQKMPNILNGFNASSYGPNH